MEGTVIDMLAMNVSAQKIVPAVWMDQCNRNGTTTKTGWSKSILREFLAFVAEKGVTSIAVWTDGAMDSGGPNGNQMDDPALATCEWFVPTLLAWAQSSGVLF